MSRPLALLIKNAKCIYPARDPGGAASASLQMNYLLPKVKIFLGIRLVESVDESRNDGQEQLAPRSGLTAKFLELFQPRKNLLPIGLFAFQRDTRDTTWEWSKYSWDSECLY